MTFSDTLYEYFYNKSKAIYSYYTWLVDNYSIFSSDEFDYVELLIVKIRKDLIDEIQRDIILISRNVK